MLFRVLSVMFVVLALASCSSDKTKHGGAGGEGGADGSGGEGGISSGELGDVTPGTQADLVANIGDRVFFAFNSSVLSDTAQETLRRQAEWLQANPDIKVTIEGHCDERGTREYNLALGERRAEAVRAYLLSLGVTKDRVATISYGKEHPEFLGSNEVAWSKNRRGVTVVN